MQVKPVTLEGSEVRLEPLSVAHADALAVAGNEPELWAYFACGPVIGRAAMRAWIEERLAQDAKGGSLGFAIIARQTGAPVGSTSYLDISSVDRRLEIGSTWLAADVRRTGINTECKYLLLRHAFETLGTNRVQLKTDARNVRSQTAIARIGAKHEGVLRAHIVMADGYLRDTVMFSIIAPEWPAVKARLEQMMRGR